MYTPRHFLPPEPGLVTELLTEAGASDFVTSTEQGLLCSTAPFIFEPNVGDHGVLQGHLARANPQWSTPSIADALVIVHGPDTYVTPSWYPSKGEHGRVVPTWNYIVAHVYGELVVHDDPDWTESLVRRLTARHENDQPIPWTPDDAPREFISAQLKAIVGIEIMISRIEAKWKLSQNRSDADIAGVLAGLVDAGSEKELLVASAMRTSLASRQKGA